MVSNICDGLSDKETLYNKISEHEMEADLLRRDMINKLAERKVFPSERQDLMELVRAVDWVADWAKEAGRILMIIHLENASDEMKDSVQNMSKACLNSVSLLADCLQELSRDRIKAIEFANEVEILEEDIDELYATSRRHLAKMDYPEFSKGEIILLNEFLDAIETVSDWCENTVDIVRSIAVRIQ
jgi:predicted phosphate transport protein (TIGR00153 family)